MILVLMYLVFHFFAILMYKWELPKLIIWIGSNTGIKKIQQVGGCEFCMEFWLAFFLFGSIALSQSQPNILIYILVCPALSNILKTLGGYHEDGF